MILVIIAVVFNLIILASFIQVLQVWPTFNGYVLQILHTLGISTSNPNTPSLAISGAVITFCIMVALSPIGDIACRWWYNFREPLRDEKERLIRLWNNVCERAGKKPDNYKIYVVDGKMPNAYALGFNCIAVTRGTLQISDNQIMAVMAHEMGHLVYGDTTKFRVFGTVCTIGQTVFLLYQILSYFFEALSRFPIPLINFAFILGSGFFRLQVWILNAILAFGLWIGAMLGARRNEYRADRYACELGFSEGLHCFLLNILDNYTYQDNPGILQRLNKTHPPTGKRVRKIEKWQDKNLAGVPTCY
jgi:Zn-dependent protease with chaperone function